MRIHLSWFDFELNNPVQLTTAAFVNVYTTLSLITASQLFLMKGSRIYLNYVHHPIFAAMDMASLLTAEPITVKLDALQYVAAQRAILFENIANVDEWTQEFSDNMAVQVGALDAKCVGLDLANGPLAADKVVSLTRPPSAETVVDGETYNLMAFEAGDVLFFEISYSYPGVPTRLYRVNMTLT